MTDSTKNNFEKALHQLVDEDIAAATYTVKLRADSGYEAEETGRVTSQQWGAALAVFADPEFGSMVYKMATSRGG